MRALFNYATRNEAPGDNGSANPGAESATMQSPESGASRPGPTGCWKGVEVHGRSIWRQPANACCAGGHDRRPWWRIAPRQEKNQKQPPAMQAADL